MTMSMASRIESVAERSGDFGVVAQLSELLLGALEVQTLVVLFYFQPGDKNTDRWFGYYEKGAVESIQTTIDCDETDRNLIATAVYLGLLQRGLLAEDHDTKT